MAERTGGDANRIRPEYGHSVRRGHDQLAKHDVRVESSKSSLVDSLCLMLL